MTDPRTMSRDDLLQLFRNALNTSKNIDAEAANARSATSQKYKKLNRTVLLAKIGATVGAILLAVLTLNTTTAVVAAVIIVAAWLGGKFFSKSLNKKRSKEYSQINALHGDNLANAAKECNLPASIFNTKYLNYLVGAVAGGRADTYKEAMVLLDNQKNYWKLEAANDSLKSELDATRQAAQNASQAAQEARNYNKKIFDELTK